MPVDRPAGNFGWAWGAIQQAVNAGADTSTIWAVVRGEAVRSGVAGESAAPGGPVRLPPGSFQAVTALRSLAVQHRRAARNFERQADSAPFTASLAPPDINARAPADRAIFPEYLVRYSLLVETADGGTEVRYVTMRDTWRPDMTVGDVRQAVMESATGLAADYGVTLAGVADLSPVTI